MAGLGTRRRVGEATSSPIGLVEDHPYSQCLRRNIPIHTISEGILDRDGELCEDLILSMIFFFFLGGGGGVRDGK